MSVPPFFGSVSASSGKFGKLTETRSAIVPKLADQTVANRWIAPPRISALLTLRTLASRPQPDSVFRRLSAVMKP